MAQAFSTHALPETEIVALAERARAGDRAAFEALYETHANELLRHAARMLGDRELARDIVQETFARAISAVDRTRPELHFRAWVYRITTNLCLRELTARRRVMPEDLDEAAANIAERAATTKTPEQLVAANNLGQQLAEAMACLPAHYREILVLRELAELRYDEIGEILALAESAVKVRLHRARGRLLSVLAAQTLSHELAAPAGAQDAWRTLCGCHKLAELAAASAEERALAQHVESCRTCREGAKQLRPLLALMPALPLDLVTAGAPPGAELSAPAGQASAASAGSGSWLLGQPLTLIAAAAAGAAGLALVAVSSVALRNALTRDAVPSEVQRQAARAKRATAGPLASGASDTPSSPRGEAPSRAPAPAARSGAPGPSSAGRVATTRTGTAQRVASARGAPQPWASPRVSRPAQGAASTVPQPVARGTDLQRSSITDIDSALVALQKPRRPLAAHYAGAPGAARLSSQAVDPEQPPLPHGASKKRALPPPPPLPE